MNYDHSIRTILGRELWYEENGRRLLQDELSRGDG
jgi:hypothetical protein